jgi:TonB family protein
MLRFAFIAVFFLSGVGCFAQQAANKETCKEHKRVDDAGRAIWEIVFALRTHKDTAGSYPAKLDELVRPPKGDAEIEEKYVRMEKFGYTVRYERTAAGWQLWASPADIKQGCGSFFASDSGKTYFRGEAGDASAADEEIPLRVRADKPGMKLKLKNSVNPQYPDGMRREAAQKRVVLALTVGRDGRVKTLQAVEGEKALVDACITAVQRWIYEPPTYHGVPVVAEVGVMILFQNGEAIIPGAN